MMSDRSKFQAGEQIAVIEGLTSLLQSVNKPMMDPVLEQILMKAGALLETPLVCLYKATGSTPPMVLHLTSNKERASELPTHLTDDDLLSHQSPGIWTPDLPAVSGLHHYVMAAQLGYLVSVPLGLEAANFGLLVACSESQVPHLNTLPLARLLAVYIAGIMENHNKQQIQNNLIHKIRQVVKIQNEIVTNLEEGVIILAPDLTVAEINPAAEAILGYANVEALRQPITTILIGSESLESSLRSTQQGIPSLTSGDLTIYHRTGRSFPAQILMSPVMIKGQLFSIIMLIRDLSQQEENQAINKQLEQRAILGEVTAIFAHEVRNPINAIMLSLQVIEDSLKEGDPNLKWLDNIRDECNKLMYLMDSVLSFAKPLEYKMAGVDLNFCSHECWSDGIPGLCD